MWGQKKSGHQMETPFHDCISEVSNWNKIFHWIAREFQIFDDVMSTIIWSEEVVPNSVEEVVPNTHLRDRYIQHTWTKLI